MANDYVAIGDWCVFEIGGRLLIGLILSFQYMYGKNFKEQSFRRSTAPIVSEKAVGVLGSWYYWKNDGELFAESVAKHEYVHIDRYRRTVSTPGYDNGKLKLSTRNVEALKEELLMLFD